MITYLAAVALCCLVEGANMDKSISALIGHLADANEDSALRRRAEQSLIASGAKDPKVVDALIKALDSKDRVQRFAAIWILGRIGPKAEKAIPELALIFESEKSSSEVRSQACSSLALIGKSSLPILERNAKSNDVKIRRLIPGRLGRIVDVKSVELLMQFLADPERDLRMSAIEALEELKEISEPLLMKGLKSANALVRAGSSDALLHINRGCAEAIAVLADLLDHPDPQVRADAAWGFRDVRSEAKPAIPALLKALADKDPRVRYRCAEALAGIGRASKPAIPGLARNLRDPDKRVRQYSALALGRIGPAAKVAAQDLADAFLEEANSMSDVREEILEALSRIGPGAREAIPILRRVLSDFKLSAAAKKELKAKVMQRLNNL